MKKAIGRYSFEDAQLFVWYVGSWSQRNSKIFSFCNLVINYALQLTNNKHCRMFSVHRFSSWENYSWLKMEKKIWSTFHAIPRFLAGSFAELYRPGENRGIELRQGGHTAVSVTTFNYFTFFRTRRLVSNQKPRIAILGLWLDNLHARKNVALRFKKSDKYPSHFIWTPHALMGRPDKIRYLQTFDLITRNLIGCVYYDVSLHFVAFIL